MLSLLLCAVGCIAAASRICGLAGKWRSRPIFDRFSVPGKLNVLGVAIKILR